jgi:hypothetical protein
VDRPVAVGTGGEMVFDPGYYAVGVRCQGDYCDDASFRICRRDK